MSRTKVKGQGHYRTKKRKTAESSPLTMQSKACVVGGTQQAASDDTIAWPPGVTRYAGGKISACCLVFVLVFKQLHQLLSAKYLRNIVANSLKDGK